MTTTTQPGTITRTLSDFALNFRLEDVAEDVRHETVRILLDCLGCAVAGLVTPAGQIAVDFAREEHGKLEASLVGADQASVMPAADRMLPLRAVAGEFIRTRPRTNATAPASQAIRTRISMMARVLMGSA